VPAHRRVARPGAPHLPDLAREDENVALVFAPARRPSGAAGPCRAAQPQARRAWRAEGVSRDRPRISTCRTASRNAAQALLGCTGFRCLAASRVFSTRVRRSLRFCFSAGTFEGFATPWSRTHRSIPAGVAGRLGSRARPLSDPGRRAEKEIAVLRGAFRASGRVGPRIATWSVLTRRRSSRPAPRYKRDLNVLVSRASFGCIAFAETEVPDARWTRTRSRLLGPAAAARRAPAADGGSSRRAGIVSSLATTTYSSTSSRTRAEPKWDWFSLLVQSWGGGAGLASIRSAAPIHLHRWGPEAVHLCVP
jgi:hypothetical protein